MGKVASCHRTSLLVAAVGFLVFGQVIDSGELEAITIDALAFHCLFSSFNLPAIKPTPTSVVTVQYAIPFRLWERPS